MNPGLPLFENEYFRVTLLEDEPIVLVVRTAKPFTTSAEVTRAFVPMLRVLDALGRSDHYLMLDSRDAVGNNDPAYEASFARYRRLLFEGFPKAAVLVKTPVGRLHSSRLMEADGEPGRPGIFNDPISALASLRAAFRRSLIPR